jgi:hypothetical protein
MPQEAPTNGPHLPWGFIGALMAIAVLLVVVEHGPRESSSATFISGAGLMPLAGVLLMLPERTWRWSGLHRRRDGFDCRRGRDRGPIRRAAHLLTEVGTSEPVGEIASAERQ